MSKHWSEAVRRQIPKKFWSEDGWFAPFSQDAMRYFGTAISPQLSPDDVWLVWHLPGAAMPVAARCWLYWVMVQNPVFPLLALEDPNLVPALMDQYMKLCNARSVNRETTAPYTKYTSIYHFYRSMLACYGHWAQVQDFHLPYVSTYRQKIPLSEKFMPTLPLSWWLSAHELPDLLGALEKGFVCVP